MLSRDQILGADDLEKKEVDVPEWGGSVYVRALSGKQRNQLEMIALRYSDQNDLSALENYNGLIAAWSIVDENGNRLFTDDEVGLLMEKSASALNTIVEEARELSGITEEDVEEIAGNSGAPPNGEPGSA